MAQSDESATGTLGARELVAFAFLYGQLVATLWIVPDWSPSHLSEPPYLAAVGGVATSLFIVVLRASGMRGSPIERIALAVFLGVMPFVYVGSWLVAPAPGWLPIELLGVAIYVPLAILGMTRSAWFLAVGIVAHGIVWDLSHYGHTPFVPDWYAVGCLVADIGIGVYTALEVPYLDRQRAPTPAVYARQQRA